MHKKGSPAFSGKLLKGHQNVQAKVSKVAITKATAIEHLDFFFFGKTFTMPTIEASSDIPQKLSSVLIRTQFGGFGLVLPC